MKKSYAQVTIDFVDFKIELEPFDLVSNGYVFSHHYLTTDVGMPADES